MLIFILGIITGILLCIFAARRNILERVIDRGYPVKEDFVGGEVEFFEPKTDAEEAAEELIEKNRNEGHPTKLEDIT